MQVSQLAGYVSEHSAYHHGETSLAGTIVGMAQNFVGSNNINLLHPAGKQDVFQACQSSNSCTAVPQTAPTEIDIKPGAPATSITSACGQCGCQSTRPGSLRKPARASVRSSLMCTSHFTKHSACTPCFAAGQFGTRLQGGKDSASPRYIFTCLAKLTRHLFNGVDDRLLTYLNEEGDSIEPEWCACSAAASGCLLICSCARALLAGCLLHERFEGLLLQDRRRGWATLQGYADSFAAVYDTGSAAHQNLAYIWLAGLRPA